MPNPFDDEDVHFSVVVNAEGQHSIWPTFAETPTGWTVAHGPADRASCMNYVRANWTDLRPRSLERRLRGEDV